MKYFICSDVHSFFTPFKKALKEAGFQISNPEHILVINGDVFDRGEETLQLYEFIKKIPKKRRIMIRGNHEQLYFDLLEKDFPESYDFSNGTVRTFCAIAGVDEKKLKSAYYYSEIVSMDVKQAAEYVNNHLLNTWNEVVKTVKKSPVTKWLFSNEWKNYFELNPYIITHSFIPIRLQDKPELKHFEVFPVSNIPDEYLEAVPNWRNLPSNSVYWDDARWGCPWRLFDVGLFSQEIENGKILVCGHWHCSDFHIQYEQDPNPENFDIYYAENLIAIDACTAYSHKCNVLVIEEIEDGNA